MRHFHPLLLLVPVSVFAASLGGPVAGYATFANGSELRAILGTPGSYRFSGPLPLPEPAVRVYPAPGSNFALVESDGGLGVVVYNGDAIESSADMAGGIALADWVAFSVDAGAAVLFSSRENRLQIWSGLPASARLTLEVAADTLPARPISAAVSEDGKTVLIASRNAVHLLPAGGAPRLLLASDLIGSLTMLRNGTDAAVADRGAGAVQLLRNVTGSADVRALVSGMEDVGAVYPSSDGASLYVAIPNVNSMASVDLGTGSMETFETGAPALALTRLRNRDTFLISAKPNQPGWVFFREDAGARAGRTVFIPAVPRIEEVAQ